jgi:hypothetical protein
MSEGGRSGPKPDSQDELRSHMSERGAKVTYV